MKPDYAIVAVLFMLACFIVPAHADNVVNSSLATVRDAWFYNQNITTAGNVSGPQTVCPAYGHNQRGTENWWADGESTYAPESVPDSSNMNSVQIVQMTTPYYNVLNPSNTYLTLAPFVVCDDNNFYALELHPWFNSTAYMPPVSANFTGAPTDGVAPLDVALTDTSTNYSNSWNWSVSPSTGVYITSTTTQNTGMHFTLNGNYTITHGASNGYKSDIETKTDYITVHNASSQYTTAVQATNIMTGTPIHGATINIYNIENGSWVNTTTIAGVAYITSIAGHHANAYGSALGFRDGDYLGFPIDGRLYSIDMVPDTNVTNVSAGNITLFVTVKDYNTAAPIQDAGVAASWPWGQWNAMTNAAGSASFIVPNKTVVILNVGADGYQSAAQSVYTGVGSGGSSYVSAIVSLHPDTVATPTITPSTTICDPTCHVITVAPTNDPYPCDADHPDNCQRKETEMGNSLVAWGPMLINFFILLTIVGGLKLMGK